MRTIHAVSLLLLTAAPLAWAQEKDDPFGTMFGERQGGDDEVLPEDELERAQLFVRRGRHDEAEALLKRLVADDAKDAPAWRSLGRLYLKTGRTKAATEVTAALRKLEPTHPTPWLFAGILAEGRGDSKGAREAYQGAIALVAKKQSLPGLEARVRLAELLTERNREAAEKTLREVLSYYQRYNNLTAGEFTWIGRACRTIDLHPDLKGEYRQRMSDYARTMLDQALAEDKEFVPAHVEAGTLALEKYNTPLAKKSFERALQTDPNNAQARVGLAHALLASFYAGKGKFGDAASNLQKALAADPTCAEAHAALAAIDVTDGNFDAALERLETALGVRPGNVDLLTVKAAVLKLRGDAEGFAAVEKAVLAERPACARFYASVAELISMKFRYAEARDLARTALAVNPGYHPALSILGVNLTRTGEEEEGRRVLKKAFDEDPYNVYVFNHLQLWDRLDEHYQVVHTPGFTLRVHKDELTVGARYAQDLLKEVKAVMLKKYEAVPERVLVELFPKHADFSARSVGLPGIPALGVCFGNVVTVLSSKEKQAVGAHSWGRTLWHEFAHVATLTATNNRISRWFSEGLSVYEEPRGRPTWQREYDAEIMTLMDRGLLLPIARLDEGFTKPKYATQVMMSYYQAGMICEFIDARWGFTKIKQLLSCYREGLDTAAGVRKTFEMEPEAFDGLFLRFLQQRYAKYAWLPPPSLEDRQELLRQVEHAPWDVSARGRLARAYALHGKLGDAESHAGLALSHAREALGDWEELEGAERPLGLPGGAEITAARMQGIRAGAGDAYLALGLVAHSRRRLPLAGRHMRRALRLGTRDRVLAHKVLGSIHRARKRWPEAIREFEKAARLSPPSTEFHQLLGACWRAAGDEEKAMAELRKVCRLDSNDAKARLTYAEWARQKGRWVDVAEVLDDINMIDPFLPKAHLLLGQALQRTALGDAAKLERAILELEMALELKVDYTAGAYYGIADCLHQLGREPERVKELVNKALADDPDHEPARALKQKLGK